MASALSAQNVTVKFGEHRALSDLQLSLEPGEVRALMGANGSGKSTFVKVLSGLYHPAANAKVSVAGAALALGTPGAGEEAGLRFVHQDLGLVETLDVVDNLAMGHGYKHRRLGMIQWRQEADAASNALKALGYDLDVRRPVGELSISERTAVAVARALSPRRAKAVVLVLDEPTANLPNTEAARLFDLIRRVRQDGTAILFVSHHLAEVFAISDSVTVLRDGVVVATQETATLTEDNLVAQMVGRELAREVRVGGEPYSARGEVLLDVKGVTSGPISALDLEVRAGEIVGIAGITGSGRESIAGILFGYAPRTGVVRVGGAVVPSNRPDKAVQLGLGLVPAERRFNAAFMEASLRENVTVIDTRDNVVAGLISRGAERRDVDCWLERLDVTPRLSEMKLENLSGGNQQKVVLARWLRQSPKVLVLDDPTQGVDIGAKAEIHRLVKEAAADGMAVVVVSTDDEELIGICNRVLVIRDGKIEDELVAPNLTTDELTACTVGARRKSA